MQLWDLIKISCFKRGMFSKINYLLKSHLRLFITTLTFTLLRFCFNQERDVSYWSSFSVGFHKDSFFILFEALPPPHPPSLFRRKWGFQGLSGCGNAHKGTKNVKKNGVLFQNEINVPYLLTKNPHPVWDNTYHSRMFVTSWQGRDKDDPLCCLPSQVSWLMFVIERIHWSGTGKSPYFQVN